MAKIFLVDGEHRMIGATYGLDQHQINAQMEDTEQRKMLLDITGLSRQVAGWLLKHFSEQQREPQKVVKLPVPGSDVSLEDLLEYISNSDYRLTQINLVQQVLELIINLNHESH